MHDPRSRRGRDQSDGMSLPNDAPIVPHPALTRKRAFPSGNSFESCDRQGKGADLRTGTVGRPESAPFGASPPPHPGDRNRAQRPWLPSDNWRGPHGRESGPFPHPDRPLSNSLRGLNCHEATADGGASRAPLGKNAKSTSALSAETPDDDYDARVRESRRARYRLQRSAAQVLPEHRRTVACRRNIIGRSLEVHVCAETGKAHYRGFESPRDSRRPFRLSQAAVADSVCWR